MTPDITTFVRSNFRTEPAPLVRIDTESVKNWSVEAVAKRVLLLAAFLLVMLVSTVAVPLFTPGQSVPRTETQYELQQLQERSRDFQKQMDKYDEVPARLAVLSSKMDAMQAHQKEKDDKEDAWRDKEVFGILGLCSAAFLLVAERFLGAFGVTFRDKDRRQALRDGAKRA